MRGIAVTGQPDIDQATAEIAIVLRDAGYGKREQDCYDEAARLRDVIMAGTRALGAGVSVTHTGMAEHDGFAAHSHEVRPDHRGVRMLPVDEDVRPDGTVVLELANTQVVLTGQGFYARCTRCPWVTENTHAKHVARRWAQEHEDGKS